MMNKSTLENTFNLNPEETDGAGDTTANESRVRRSRGKIVDYADADPELKEMMDRIIAPIDTAPNSREAIILYGQPPLKKLGEVADELLKVQGKFNEQVNVMASSMDKLQSGLKELNLDKFGTTMRKALSSAAEGAVKGGKGAFKTVKGIWNSVSGKNAKRTEEEKLVQSMHENLPQLLGEMIKLVKNVQETDKGLKVVMQEAEKLGTMRVEVVREIGMYLGASSEVLNRYNKEFILDAQKNFEASGDPEDELYLKDILKRKDDFVKRTNRLEASRLECLNAARLLDRMLDTMQEQRDKADEIINHSQHQWKAMMAEAGIAGSSLKAAETLKKADKFGDDMIDQLMQLSQQAHQMTLEGSARGTIDPMKLVEMSESLQKMLEQDEDARKQRLKQLEEVSVQLRGTADKMIEAGEEADRARLLDAEEEAAKAAEVSNDNAAAKQKNTGTNGPAAAPKP